MRVLMTAAATRGEVIMADRVTDGVQVLIFS
jgi:hypothetical protein